MAGKKTRALKEREPLKSSGKYLVAIYAPASIFSLRMSPSSSTGGKTLFIPTPYSVKLALVDVGFRLLGGFITAEKIFNIVKDKHIRFLPPQHIVITHTFQKMLREDSGSLYKETINYREYCFYRGNLKIATNISDLKTDEIELLKKGLILINYFGKRGSFFQFIGFEEKSNEELDDEGYTRIKDTSLTKQILERYGIAQPLDDFAYPSDPKLFSKINSYSSEKLDKSERPYTLTLLPYHLIRSSYGYTYWSRKKQG